MEETGIPTLTAQEEKELARVYDCLCDFSEKLKIRNALKPTVERLGLIAAHKKSPDSIKIYDADRNILSEEQIAEEETKLKEKERKHTDELQRFNKKEEKKIRPCDLGDALKMLGKKSSKKEIEDMIWEVDENLDGCVDWEEFKLMFQRNLNDATGLEPFQLFNVVQFMTYDKDNSGAVSVDETMAMLYARYGKDRLEKQMKSLFGDDLKTADGDGELDFSEYLKAVSVRFPTKGGKKFRK